MFWIPIFFSFLLGQELSTKVHFAFWCYYSCIMRSSINPYQTDAFLTRTMPLRSNEILSKVWSRPDLFDPSTFYIKMSRIPIFASCLLCNPLEPNLRLATILRMIRNWFVILKIVERKCVYSFSRISCTGQFPERFTVVYVL